MQQLAYIVSKLGSPAKSGKEVDTLDARALYYVVLHTRICLMRHPGALWGALGWYFTVLHRKRLMQVDEGRLATALAQNRSFCAASFDKRFSHFRRMHENPDGADVPSLDDATKIHRFSLSTQLPVIGLSHDKSLTAVPMMCWDSAHAVGPD